MLYALHEACDMVMSEGLDAIFARHARLAHACRAAVSAWGLEIQCADARYYSPVLTGVMTPAGVDADAIRKVIHDRFDTSLGTGLGKVKGKMFRIGHLGDCNDVTLMGTLAAVEMGLKISGVALKASGVVAAMEVLSAADKAALKKVA
jgi:alanine-glyoxylate transaminase / serine-glyoxylate transaminase / serine-pyruvate transaminase